MPNCVSVADEGGRWRASGDVGLILHVFISSLVCFLIIIFLFSCLRPGALAGRAISNLRRAVPGRSYTHTLPCELYFGGPHSGPYH